MKGWKAVVIASCCVPLWSGRGYWYLANLSPTSASACRANCAGSQYVSQPLQCGCTAETDSAAFALQCFKGVIPQPIKPKQPKSAAEAAAGPTQSTAAEEAGQQATE